MKYDVTLTEQAENDLRGNKTKKLVTVIRVMYSGRDMGKRIDEFTKL